MRYEGQTPFERAVLDAMAAHGARLDAIRGGDGDHESWHGGPDDAARARGAEVRRGPQCPGVAMIAALEPQPAMIDREAEQGRWLEEDDEDEEERRRQEKEDEGYY